MTRHYSPDWWFKTQCQRKKNFCSRTDRFVRDGLLQWTEENQGTWLLLLQGSKSVIKTYWRVHSSYISLCPPLLSCKKCNINVRQEAITCVSMSLDSCKNCILDNVLERIEWRWLFFFQSADDVFQHYFSWWHSTVILYIISWEYFLLVLHKETMGFG